MKMEGEERKRCDTRIDHIRQPAMPLDRSAWSCDRGLRRKKRGFLKKRMNPLREQDVWLPQTKRMWLSFRDKANPSFGTINILNLRSLGSVLNEGVHWFRAARRGTVKASVGDVSPMGKKGKQERVLMWILLVCIAYCIGPFLFSPRSSPWCAHCITIDLENQPLVIMGRMYYNGCTIIKGEQRYG